MYLTQTQINFAAQRGSFIFQIPPLPSESDLDYFSITGDEVTDLDTIIRLMTDHPEFQTRTNSGIKIDLGILTEDLRFIDIGDAQAIKTAFLEWTDGKYKKDYYGDSKIE